MDSFRSDSYQLKIGIVLSTKVRKRFPKTRSQVHRALAVKKTIEKLLQNPQIQKQKFELSLKKQK